MYADHAATSHPLLYPPTGDWGNPGSSHARGRAAAAALDAARARVRAALRCPPSAAVVFTGSGTEADNLALLQPAWGFVVTLATEHHAVYLAAQAAPARTGAAVVLLTPDGVGRVADWGELRALLRDDPRCADRPGVVSLAYVNNEIGTVHDLAAAGAVLAAANAVRAPAHRVWLHTDAVQAPGHVDLRMDAGGGLAAADLVTLSAHKFHGPYGLGLLVCRDGPRAAACLRGLLVGGGQQGGLRPGTEAVAAAVAAAAALEDAADPARLPERRAHYRALADAVWAVLLPHVASGLVLPTGPPAPGPDRAPHHVSFCVRGAHRRELTAALEADGGVLVSGGSACSTHSDLPSHVLAALGVPPAYIHGSLRISFGHTNTLAEVQTRLCPALARCLAREQERHQRRDAKLD